MKLTITTPFGGGFDAGTFTGVGAFGPTATVNATGMPTGNPFERRRDRIAVRPLGNRTELTTS